MEVRKVSKQLSDLRAYSRSLILVSFNRPHSTLWVRKKQYTKLLPITSPNLNRFSEFFSLPELAVNLQQKRVYISHHALSMSLHYLKYECQKTIDNLKKCIAINDKSQGSCDVLLYYNFITQFAGERIYKIGENLAKLRTKWLIVSCAPFALRFFF